MTDQIAGTTLISSATYGSANQLLTITGTPYAANYTETRSNNSLKQLTQITSGGLSIDYNYPSSNNNGKIASQTDSISGETVTYTYDSLNRLATAQNQTGFSPLWGQSFTYDGFSNLTGTSVTQGSAPTLSASYDVNNHAGGEDANGNPGSIYLPADGSSYAATYDVENRLRSTGSSTIFYSYAPGNRRVWQGTGSWTATYGTCNPTPGSTEEITFWGVNGQKLMSYNLTEGFVGSQCHFTATAIGTNYYFGNRLIKNTGGYVYPDRLGSIGKFYPYGIERPSATTNGTEKFTGYLRDAESGNDYAINRYMSPGNGRFITPDRMFGHLADPGSLNKYVYVGGDPVNRVDRSGKDYEYYDADGDYQTMFTSEHAEYDVGDDFGDDPSDFPSNTYSNDDGGDGSFQNAMFLASQDSSTPCSGNGSGTPTCVAFLASIGIVAPAQAPPSAPVAPAEPACPPLAKGGYSAAADVFFRLTHPLDALVVNSTIFAAAGAHFAVAGAVVLAGCLDPTPAEPATCVAGTAMAIETSVVGARLSVEAVRFFDATTLPAFKDWGCRE